LKEDSKFEPILVVKPALYVSRRMLARGEAARYCSIGVTLFDALVASGILPPAKALGEKRICWDIHELDRAIDELPYAANAHSSQPLDQYLDVA
jgi:predicted DNA-binding transcriptional regulator AlpA